MTDVLYAFAAISGTYPEALPQGAEGGQVELIATDTGHVLIQRIGAATVERLQAAENVAGLREVADWLMVHDQVGAAASRVSPTYPFSFATLFSDVDTLRTTLAAKGAALAAYFDQVRNADEWAFKVCRARRQSARLEDAEQATGGLDYLRRRRSRNTESEAEADAEMLAELTVPLISLSREWTTLRPGLAPNAQLEVIGTFAALVDRASATAFEAEARRLADASPDDLVLTVSGPWPPFSFRPAL